MLPNQNSCFFFLLSGRRALIPVLFSPSGDKCFWGEGIFPFLFNILSTDLIFEVRLLKRIDLLLSDSLYNEYLQRNAVEEMEPKFCRHDINHHFDVARITFILMLENNDLEHFLRESKINSRLAAKEVIYAAGLLHDIGKWKEYRDGEEHASYSASLARGLLPRALFTPDETEIICQAIYEHRNISNDMSFLGERLYRANNLSRICSRCVSKEQCTKVQQKEISMNLPQY